LKGVTGVVLRVEKGVASPVDDKNHRVDVD
jgi:hypothetical protein